MDEKGARITSFVGTSPQLIEEADVAGANAEMKKILKYALLSSSVVFIFLFKD